MWKVGSLFSGIGGIEYGFEKTGKFETRWFVEREPYAQAILRKHWPGVTIYEDVKQVRFNEIEKVDVLTGGFPCQDISNAGNRKGITGERSGLWKEYLRAISEIRPRIAFIENVSALRNRGLNVVLADLASIGYDAEWHCLSACAIGAPQTRDRMFIMAFPNNFDNWKQCKKSIPKKKWKKAWNVCPRVLRVANGVPNRIHRIKGIGNAVVPQVAEYWAEIIAEKLEPQGKAVSGG